MKLRASTAAALAAAVILSLPALAIAGHGNGRGNGNGNGHAYGRGGDGARVERQAPARGTRVWGQSIERGGRASAPQVVARGGSSRSVAGYRVERTPVRYRDGGGSRVYAGGTTRTYGGGDGGYVRYRSNHPTYSGTRYRDGGYRTYSGYRTTYRTSYRPAYVSYYPRYYYYSDYFSRPRYSYCSGFSLGISIGLRPSYGYRYWDPYCESGFAYLGDYYDHCHHHHHPTAILVVYRDAPIGTCVYDEGEWVVDDCYDY